MIDPQGEGAYGVTYGPIWGNPTAPIIEIDLENIDEGLGLPVLGMVRVTMGWGMGRPAVH